MAFIKLYIYFLQKNQCCIYSRIVTCILRMLNSSANCRHDLPDSASFIQGNFVPQRESIPFLRHDNIGVA